MALIKCPECKKSISNQAQSCPKCGRPLSDADRNPKEKTSFGTILVVIVIIGMVANAVLSGNDGSNTARPTTSKPRVEQAKSVEPVKKGASKAEYDARISSVALIAYTKQGYPATVEKYGSRLTEIEHYRRRTAEMALESGKCDIVNIVDLSIESRLNHLKFWAECANGQRIYLTENEIDADSEVLTQEDKAWTEAAARQACREGIKERALLPSEVKFHTLLGTKFYHAPLSHNVILEMNFDATNAFGVKVPYTATCHFEPGKVGTIEISLRN